MQDHIIDFLQIDLYLDELDNNPDDRDPRMDELVKLYRFQQELIRRWEADEGEER